MTERLQANPSTRREHVGHTGIYPASGPRPPGDLVVRGQGELGHPEERQRLLSGSREPWPGNAALLTVGRILFGGYFLYNGINHFRQRDMLAGYAKSKAVPAADVAVPLSGALLIAGGTSVLTGTRPKVGAALLATFLIGVSPMMHAFWDIENPEQRMGDFVNFWKNMALLGGTCLVAALPEPWPASVDV